MCFVLLLVYVIGIANGPVGLVVFYEQEVKNRVIELGLTTTDRIKKTSIITVIALFVPMLVLVPYMVYGIWFCQDPRFVLKGTEDMVSDYHEYWFHIKGFFIGEALASVDCAISGLVVQFIL